MLPWVRNLLLGCKEVSQGLLEGLGSVNWPLTRKKKGRGRKKTMLSSRGSHNTEVLNCQQQCENDVIKGSWKEEPGEQHKSDVWRQRQELFRHGIWNFAVFIYTLSNVLRLFIEIGDDSVMGLRKYNIGYLSPGECEVVVGLLENSQNKMNIYHWSLIKDHCEHEGRLPLLCSQLLTLLDRI